MRAAQQTFSTRERILGVAEALWGGYVATGYVDAIGFALVIIMLLARPYGLFGKHNERA